MLSLSISPWRSLRRRRWPKPGDFSITAFSGGTLGPGLIADFKRRRYALPKSMSAAQILAATPTQITSAVKSTAFADLFEFSRASTATFFDASGTLVTADINQPRFAPDGLLLEGPATNFIRNSSLTGAVTGDVSAGGGLPTNVTMSSAVAGDLTTTVTATGTEFGRPFVDIRFSGQPTTTRYLNLEAGTAIPAVTGEQRAFSAYVRLVSGSLDNLSDLNLTFAEKNSGGGNATGGPATTVNIKPTVNSAARRVVSRTMTATDCAYVLPFFRIPATAAPVDFTLRLSLPQCEAGLEATSAILTSGSAVTRAADHLKLSTKSAALLQRSGAGLLLQAMTITGTGGKLIGRGSGRLLGLGTPATSLIAGETSGSVVQLTVASSLTTPLPGFGLAMGWDGTAKAASYNGLAAVSSATGLADMATSEFRLGRDSAGNFANGFYRQIVLWPARPADAALPGKAVPYV